MTVAIADIELALGSAWADHQAGRLEAAERGYRHVLGLRPDQPDALHLLGVLAHQAGRHREAVGLIGQALQGRPGEAAFLCNLGEAHRATGEVTQAIDCQRRALALDPELAAAHNNLGLALEATGARDEAMASYRRALALQPEHVDALINLGNLLAADGRIVAATEHFETAIGRAPSSAKAHYNLANALRDQGLDQAAIGHYRRALDLHPDYPEAHNNLGLLLLQTHDWPAAVACFERALATAPDQAEAHNNLGLAHEAMGDFEAARRAYQRAIEVDPGLARAHNNLGRIQHRAEEHAAAIASCRKALALDPDYVDAHANLGHILKDMGRVEDSIEAFLRAVAEDADHADSTAQLVYQLQQGCQWARLSELEPKVDAQTDAAIRAGIRPGETPFGSLTRCSDPARHLQVAKAWAHGIEQRVARTGVRFAFDDRRLAKPRLTLGYLSCDYRDHPVTHQIVGVLGNHDRARFEVRAYGYGHHGPSPDRDRIAAAVDHFVDLDGLSDVAAARRIAADQVDILIDLAGYTKGNRLQIAAFRPAPVQVSYLGFLGTTGGRFIDYLIGDRICMPREEAGFFTEQLAHLPEGCLVFAEHGPRPANPYRRLDFGLPEEGFVFCSLNANHKIEPVMFELWMQLLRQVPDSVLWLYRGSEVAVQSLQREAKEHRLEPRRLIFADRVPYAENLKRLQLADLALDTRLYNGGLTSANALFAGVPLISLRGSDAVSRMAESVLRSLSLPELVAESLEGYHDLALDLARRPDRLAALRTALDARLAQAPVFDSLRFTCHLEAAYGAMWRRFVAGEPPAPIEVAAHEPARLAV